MLENLLAIGFDRIIKSFLAPEVLAHRLEAAYGFLDVRCQLITATLRDVYLVESRVGSLRRYAPSWRSGHRPSMSISGAARISIASLLSRWIGSSGVCSGSAESGRMSAYRTFSAYRASAIVSVSRSPLYKQ